MLNQIKHFGTSGEIATLIEEVNAWLRENDGKLEVLGISESQGGSLGDATSSARVVPATRLAVRAFLRGGIPLGVGTGAEAAR